MPALLSPDARLDGVHVESLTDRTLAIASQLEFLHQHQLTPISQDSDFRQRVEQRATANNAAAKGAPTAAYRSVLASAVTSQSPADRSQSSCPPATLDEPAMAAWLEWTCGIRGECARGYAAALLDDGYDELELVETLSQEELVRKFGFKVPLTDTLTPPPRGTIRKHTHGQRGVSRYHIHGPTHAARRARHTLTAGAPARRGSRRRCGDISRSSSC